MSGSDLTGARLVGTRLVAARLVKATLRDADLCRFEIGELDEWVPGLRLPEVMGWNVSEDGIHPPLPDSFEIRDAGESRHQVDPRRSNSELDDSTWGRKICGLDSQIRAKKLPDGGENTLCVFARRLDEDVEVLGRARTGVKGDGVGSNNEISSFELVQELDELFVVAGSHEFPWPSKRKADSPAR
ncbi:MAG TPA: pentapeptide repeat-containing protein, partial [Thermoanaerobaculia bacterium]